MISQTGVLAVVIGRAGSKGLPGKNSLKLAGKPMICHTIEHAKAAQCVTRIVVSTDGHDIASAASGMDVQVIDRPPELTTDTATVSDVVNHALKQSNSDEAVIVVLYANVPIRPADLIDRAVDLLVTTGADSVQSYSDVSKHHPFWMCRIDNENRISAYVENKIDRRQDLPELFLPNGGVIAATRASLLAAQSGGGPHSFLGDDRRGIQTPPGSVVDIDDASDLALAQAILMREPAGAIT